MKEHRPEDEPLGVSVIGGQVVIRVGVEVLADCIPQSPGWDGGEVTDPLQFAKDIVYEIERDNEVGDTPMSRLFEDAAHEAAAMGSTALRT